MFDTIYQKAGAAFLAGWLSWSGAGCLGSPKVTGDTTVTIYTHDGKIFYRGPYRNVGKVEHFSSDGITSTPVIEDRYILREIPPGSRIEFWGGKHSNQKK